MNPMEDDSCPCLSDDSMMCLCVGDPEEAGEALERGLRIAVAKAEGMGEKGQAIKDAVDKAMVVVKSLDLESLKGDLKGRGNVVMTRVGNEDLEVMDTLVEAGLFDSRSECAAFLIHSGVKSREDLVSRVEDTAKKISKLKEKLKKELS